MNLGSEVGLDFLMFEVNKDSKLDICLSLYRVTSLVLGSQAVYNTMHICNYLCGKFERYLFRGNVTQFGILDIFAKNSNFLFAKYIQQK